MGNLFGQDRRIWSKDRVRVDEPTAIDPGASTMSQPSRSEMRKGSRIRKIQEPLTPYRTVLTSQNAVNPDEGPTEAAPSRGTDPPGAGRRDPPHEGRDHPEDHDPRRARPAAGGRSGATDEAMPR